MEPRSSSSFGADPGALQKTGRVGVALAVLVVFAALPIGAQQTTTGSIAGRVIDETSAVVVGAKVTVTSGQGAKAVATDSRGRFVVPHLTPERYAVRSR